MSWAEWGTGAGAMARGDRAVPSLRRHARLDPGIPDLHGRGEVGVKARWQF